MICNAVIDTNVLVSALLSDKADTATNGTYKIKARERTSRAF